MIEYEIPDKPGVYTLIIELTQESVIKIGQLGFQHFPKGFYVYTGSALGMRRGLSLKRRVGRHLSSEKRKRWHIDYLLNSRFTEIVSVVYSKTNLRMECIISKNLEELEDATNIVEGFGSSDCRRDCRSHLHYFSNATSEIIIRNVNEVYAKLGLSPRALSAR